MDVLVCEQMQPLSSSSTKQDRVFSLTCPPCELLAHSCPLSVSPFKVEKRDHYLWNELNARKESSAGRKGKNGDRCSSSLFFHPLSYYRIPQGRSIRERERKEMELREFQQWRKLHKVKKYSSTHCWLEQPLYEVFFNHCKYEKDKVNAVELTWFHQLVSGAI